MKTYKITITDERPHNFGHRLTFEGLKNGYHGVDGETHSDFLRSYDYDKEVPPFWSAGIAETRCFTLPYAVYLICYDLCQWHDDLQMDGDEFAFEWEGQTFKIPVGTWPRCDEAQEIEKAFRELHKIPKDKLRD